MTRQPPYTGRHGAVPLASGKTRFALWAPDARRVDLELNGEQRLPIPAGAEGWYVVEAPCSAGTRYRYVIDDDLAVPDPASRFQADDVHGPSVVIDHTAHAWRNADWRGRPWHETVLYELHVGLFGGYAGVERQLPRLAKLGVTAIELMPLNEFPGERNWGYDGVLPYAPESAYGTPEQLKQLIDAAHGNGLMVFLDVVYNHFGPDGNYLGRYAKGFFRHDLGTPWGDAIDFRRREVRDFFIDNALMWLNDYRFDGLRFDAVHAIDDPTFLEEMARRIRDGVAPERHVHLVLENEHNAAHLLEDAYDAQWNDDWHNVLHVLLTGERLGYYADFCQDATARLARCLGEGFIYQGDTTRRGTSRGQPSAHLPPTAFVSFLQNHDQTGNRAFGERLIALADADALRAATLLLLLSPMIPLLFMGEEWGARQPFLFFTSHHGELAGLVREGRRNEFADFDAFASAEQRELIPDPNAESTFEASRPDFTSAGEAGHAPWLKLYRELLALRHAHIVPRLAGSRALSAEVLAEGAVSARWRLGDGKVLRIALNLSERPATLSNVPNDAGPDGLDLLFESDTDAFSAYRAGTLPARTAIALWEPAR